MPTINCGFPDGPAGLGSDLLSLYGPTLLVDIGFDEHFRLNSGRPPDLAVKKLRALLDTGAVESCIDAQLAMHLKLPIVDRRLIAGSAGAHEVNVHVAHIHIPHLAFTIYGLFSAVDLSGGGQPHAALIGRTFLRAFRMTYDGSTGAVLIDGPIMPRD